MTNRFFIAILLFFCAVTNARAIETINGCEFDSLNGKWYQLEDNISLRTHAPAWGALIPTLCVNS